MSLRTQSIRGVGWLGGSAAARQAIRVAIRLILARMIGPTAFGLVAMADVLTSLLLLLSEGGLAQALVQSPNESEEERSTVFWITLLVSTGCAGLVFLAANLTSELFKSPDLAPVVAVLCWRLPVLAPQRVYEAILARDLKFRAIGLRTLIASIVGGIAGLGAAMTGMEVWALVVGVLVTDVVSLVFLATSSSWQPRLLCSVRAYRRLARFGNRLAVGRLLGVASRNIDNFLVGRYLGADALGAYALAYQAILTPAIFLKRPLASVAFPVFSRLANELPRLASGYTELLAASSLVGGALPSVAIAIAPAFVHTVLGPNWAAAALGLQVLSFVAFLETWATPTESLLMALSRTDVTLRWMILHLLATVAAVLIGLKWGVQGVFATWSLFQSIVLITTRVDGVRLAGLTRLCATKPLATLTPAVFAAAATGWVISNSAFVTPLLAVTIATVGSVAVYAAASYLTYRAGWNALGTALSSLRQGARRNRSGG